MGAEALIPLEYTETVLPLIADLKRRGFTVVALEQDKQSVPLPHFDPPQKIALFLGEEVNGIQKNILKECDAIIEIPMFGTKESFNVSVATGIVLYALSIQKTIRAL